MSTNNKRTILKQETMDDFEANRSMYVGEYGSFRQLTKGDFFLNSVSIVSGSGIISIGKYYVIAEVVGSFVETYFAKLTDVQNWEEWVMLKFEAAMSEQIFLINLVEDFDTFYSKWKVLDLDFYRNEIRDHEIRSYCGEECT